MYGYLFKISYYTLPLVIALVTQFRSSLIYRYDLTAVRVMRCLWLTRAYGRTLQRAEQRAPPSQLSPPPPRGASGRWCGRAARGARWRAGARPELRC